MKVKGLIVVAAIAMAAVLFPNAAFGQLDQNNSNPVAMPNPQAPGPGQPSEIERAPGMTSTSNPRANNQPTSMRDSLGAPGQNGQEILDKRFVRSAAESNMADVRLGTLAAEKGSPDIKDLAQKMVDDHSQLNKDLESVADSMGVMLPKKISKEQQAEYDKLNGLSGKDFDTEYVDYLAKVHWQEVHNYRMEASVAVDPDLQTQVMKALGMMREHIGLINKAATAEGINLPPRPARMRQANTTTNTQH